MAEIPSEVIKKADEYVGVKVPLSIRDYQAHTKRVHKAYLDGYQLALASLSTDAIGFAEWIKKEGYNQRSGVDWAIYRNFLSDVEIYTTEQLYEIYKQSKQVK